MLTPNGDSQLTVRSQGLTDTASLFVKSDNGNAVLTIDGSGAGGASLIMNGQDGQVFTIMNQSSTIPSLFTMATAPATVGQVPFLSYDPTGPLTLGDGLAGGVAVRNGLQVRDEFVVPDPTAGINLTMTAPVMGQIAMSSSTGLLALGSSSLNPDIITLTQTSTAAGTGVCAIGNGGSAVTVKGGVGGSQTSIITTNSTGVSSLLLGASAANDRAIFINDTGGAADTAVVDITKGTAAGVALRLQGYGPAGTAATVSTNSGTGQLNISSGPADVAPAFEIVPANITANRQMIASGTWVPVLLRAPAVTGPNVTFDVDCSPLPSGFAMVYGTAGNPTAGDQGGFFSVMIYTGPGNVIQGGGIGGVPGIVTCQPSPASNTSLRIVMVLQTSANYSIYGITLLGG
jgi:hypothetical protein